MKVIISGILTFVIVSAVVTNVVTGTDAGSEIIQQVLPVAVAGVAVYASMKGFGGK